MQKITFLIIITLLVYTANAQTFNWDWVSTIESEGDSFAYKSVADSEGNLYVAGKFSTPSITFGSYTLNKTTEDDYQTFLVKYQSNGSILWARTFQHTNYSGIRAITLDSENNVLITGDFSASISFDDITLTNNLVYNTTMYVAKILNDGSVAWAVEAGAASTSFGYAFPFDIKTDLDGNVYVSGRHKFSQFIISNSINLQMSGPCNYFIIKYNSNGVPLWAKAGYSSSSVENTVQSSLSVDDIGNVYMAGPFTQSIIFNGTALSTGASVSMFLVKFDTFGETLWLKKYGDSGYVYSVGTEISGGNIYMLGTYSSTALILGSSVFPFNGYSRMFITKLDNDGNIVWAKSEGGIYNDIGTGIALIPDGIYLSGYFNSPSLTLGSSTLLNPLGNGPTSNENSFIVKYDYEGNVIAAAAPQNTGQNRFFDITAANNIIYTCGGYSNNFILGDSEFSSPGVRNTVVAKLNTEALEIVTNNKNNFSVYPNPASNIINIAGSDMFVDAVYTITDLAGKTVQKGNLNTTINISGLAQGMYIFSSEGKSTKFIKE